ncbi:hypothetical protein GCM10027613_02090 [Microlunatus endophyticus]
MARHAEADIPVLILEKLSRIHGSGELTVHALRRINLAVRAGELIAVMGPSGSGKSTLLNLAGALDKPTSGRVLIEGEDVTSMRPSALAAVRRRKVGFVFQDFNLVPSLTAAENVSLPLELDGWSPRRTRQPVAEALDSVGLSGQVADRYPSELSGGQQQRIAIARSLVGPRRLVLADEPTGALDTETGDQIMAVLRERCDAGAAGLLVTHEPRHAGWADRVIFLRDGAVIDSAESAAVDERLMGASGDHPGRPRGATASRSVRRPSRRLAEQLAAGIADRLAGDPAGPRPQCPDHDHGRRSGSADHRRRDVEQQQFRPDAGAGEVRERSGGHPGRQGRCRVDRRPGRLADQRPGRPGGRW